MACADIALRRAIRDRLLADAALVALLGGPRVYDAPPRNAPKPCVIFARSRRRDWSAQAAPGREHDLALDVWSAQEGVREALQIADQARALLDDAPLTLEGFALVRLQARGARYIVAPAGTGAFAGHADEIAYRDEAGWRFAKPQTGWIAWSQAEGAPFVYADGGWTRLDWRMLAPANLRLAGPGAIVTVAAARALAASDDGRVLAVNSARAVALTIPAALPVGFACAVVQTGMGQASFVAGAGATLGQVANAFRTSGRHARADLVCVSAGAFVLSGSLVV